MVQRGDGYGYSLVAKTDVRGTPPQHRDASHPALYLPGLKAEVSRAKYERFRDSGAAGFLSD